MPAFAQPLDLLAIAPHPDDAEISVGGTLLTCHRQGLRVGVLDLTNGEPTPHGSPEIRATETAAATKILQLDWRQNLGLPNRTLEHTLEARRKLATVFRQTRPRIILAPYWEDSHPDHVAATSLIEAARFWSKLTRTDMDGEPFHPPRIFYYFSIHLRIHPQPSFVFDISDAIDEKMASVHCYASQFLTGRVQEFPTALDDIRDRARYWGWSINSKYGEPFASRESVRMSSFASTFDFTPR
ncbi:bacillithiol biosynthesis deacetylase BshB1 [Schlesneria paludicola]|uniref:bacillithiol biosynthesis deacetylase BshB1 n=1 Tax=Schlesneria paludicola TaxID=360056 RepID=UPI00029AF947|nr:bacillithiol biosynthesis deacetylase BshB1 [Schlesneria paludicola]